MKLRPRMTNEQIKARLILIVGLAISAGFILTIGALLFGLLFVTQPLDQAPNDQQAWEILSPLTLTMSGVMAGLLAANGLKDKDKKDPE